MRACNSYATCPETEMETLGNDAAAFEGYGRFKILEVNLGLGDNADALCTLDHYLLRTKCIPQYPTSPLHGHLNPHCRYNWVRDLHYSPGIYNSFFGVLVHHFWGAKGCQPTPPLPSFFISEKKYLWTSTQICGWQACTVDTPIFTDIVARVGCNSYMALIIITNQWGAQRRCFLLHAQRLVGSMLWWPTIEVANGPKKIPPTLPTLSTWEHHYSPYHATSLYSRHVRMRTLLTNSLEITKE